MCDAVLEHEEQTGMPRDQACTSLPEDQAAKVRDEDSISTRHLHVWRSLKYKLFHIEVCGKGGDLGTFGFDSDSDGVPHKFGRTIAGHCRLEICSSTSGAISHTEIVGGIHARLSAAGP